MADTDPAEQGAEMDQEAQIDQPDQPDQPDQNDQPEEPGKQGPIGGVLILLVILGVVGLLVGKSGLTGKVVGGDGEGLKFTGTGATIHWQKDTPIPYMINVRGSDDVNDTSDIDALQRSIRHFESIGGANMRFEYLGTTAETEVGYDQQNPADNENLFVWLEDEWPFDPAALAVTVTIFVNETGRMVDGDIAFNGVNYKWTSDPSGVGNDIENTMAHELGHLMGLAHNPGHTAATMFPASFPGELDKRSLHNADIATLVTLYGDGSPISAPTPDAESADGGSRPGQGGAGPGGGGDGPGGSNDADVALGASRGCGGGSIIAPTPRAPWGMGRR